jgi:UDP:flavonoid glycosyltransferase YjiC (YdhE family)
MVATAQGENHMMPSVTGQPHIVFATAGSHGDLYPFIALGREMQRRGYRATIATSRNHQPRVLEAGLGFRHMRPDPQNTPAFHAQFMHPRTGGEFVYRHHLAPAIRNSYSDLLEATEDADVLVSQSLMALAAPLVAAKTGIPWISTVLQPMSFFSVHERPNYLPYPVLPWLCGRYANVHEQVFKYVKEYTAEWVRPVTELKQSLDLPSSFHPMYEGQHSSQCVLALFSPLFGGPQPDWPEAAIQTGIAQYTPAVMTGLPAGLEAFLAQNELPLAVFTLSTAASNDAGDFYLSGLSAAGKAGMRALLVTSGLSASSPLPDPLPPWAYRIDYVAFAKVFQHADVIVHAGGIGTAFLALQSGTPQILVPHAHDQLDNALRLVKLGVGIVIPKKQADQRALGNALRAVVCNAGMREKAATVAEQACRENGVARACDEIEKACIHV